MILFKTIKLTLKVAATKAVILKYMEMNLLPPLWIVAKDEYAHKLILGFISIISKVEVGGLKDEIHKANKYLLAMAAMGVRGMQCMELKEYNEAMNLQVLIIHILATNNILVKTRLDLFLFSFIRDFASDENQTFLYTEMKDLYGLP